MTASPSSSKPVATDRSMSMTPEQIASRLTDAQRRKIMAIGDGQPREFAWGSSGLFLIERGFAFENELGARHLTDLGHSVRAILKEKM